MKPADRAPARLAVRLPNWLGDVVMALPALAAVRAALPQASIVVAGTPGVLPIFSEETDAAPDERIELTGAGEMQRLREARVDAVLLLTNSFRSAWTARLAGIPERWGYAAGGRGMLLTEAVRRPRKEVHQSEFYLELVGGLGIPASSGVPRIRVTEGTLARARALLREQGIGDDEPVVGFAPGAAYGHAKRWPPERVGAVVRRLAAERGARCVLVGAPADREAGRAIESSVPSDIRVVNLIGRTDLRLLSGILASCRAFVSNDSGAMHLAAAVGVPVTAMFGPTKAHVTAPLGEHDILRHKVFCSPCMLRDCPIDHRCMKRITVDEVYGAVTRRMDSRA